MDEISYSDNVTVIRIKLDTYYELDKIRQKRKLKNLRETGKVGDANFDSIISDLLKKNGSKNYQPLSGEESKPQGGNKYGKMADRTTPKSDTKRLDGSERKPRESNNAGA